MNQVDRRSAAERDQAVFWSHPHFHGMGLLKARFRHHRYALHTHPTYVIALITGGCERVRVGRRQETALADSIIVVNPEECHDGAPGCDEGWAYRTFYPDVALLASVAEELEQPALPWFPRSILHDRALSGALWRAHRSAEDDDTLAAETTMRLALRDLVLRHADRRPIERMAVTGAARRVIRYRAMIEADPARGFTLEDFAAAGGVTRYQVIRDFRRQTGLTPSGFIRNQRVCRASRMIAEGETLAHAAAASGFADQSHLTRAFKLAHGFTPGVLRAATTDSG